MTAPERFAEKSDLLLQRGHRPYMTHRKLPQSKSIATANDLRARLGEEVLRRNMSWDGDRSDLSRDFPTRPVNHAWPNCA
jgi:hypothetical protein